MDMRLHYFFFVDLSNLWLIVGLKSWMKKLDEDNTDKD
jgi:hypothetical protein